MRKLAKFSFVLLLGISNNAHAAEDYLQPYFKTEAIKIGGGKYYYKGLIHAYDAELFSPAGVFDPNQVFALKLTYKTSIEGADIADKSIEQMDDQSTLDKAKSAQWSAQMKSIFPDVEDGTSLTAVNLPTKGVVFFENEKKIGEIDDHEFAGRFFDIWLSAKTSDQSLRTKLLGSGE